LQDTTAVEKQQIFIN